MDSSRKSCHFCSTTKGVIVVDGVCDKCGDLSRLLRTMKNTTSVKEGWLDTLGQYLLIAQRLGTLDKLPELPVFAKNKCAIDKTDFGVYFCFPASWNSTVVFSYRFDEVNDTKRTLLLQL